MHIISRLSFVIATSLVCAGSVQAVDFVNGSFSGPTNEHSLVPPGWTATETPDTVSAAGHPFGFSAFTGIDFQPYGDSTDSGQFAWIAGTAGPREAISQQVSGLQIGVPTPIRFEYTNLGLYDSTGSIATAAFGSQNYNNSGELRVLVDGNVIATTPSMAAFPTAGTNVWQTFSTSFTPTLSTHTFTFAAFSTSANGSGHVGMGIDAASLVVPEPASAVLLMSIGGVLMRRNRRA